MAQEDSSYAKPFLPVSEQVELLRDRGIETGPSGEAEALLRRVGYYRLSAYWYPYRIRHSAESGEIEVTSAVEPGTSLRAIEQIYDFDAQVRSLLLEAVEAIEVAIRFRVGHTLGFRHRFAHRRRDSLDPCFTGEPQSDSSAACGHDEWLREYELQEGRSQEEFVRHFRQAYGPHLPVWVATEVMSFGTLRRLYLGTESPRVC